MVHDDNSLLAPEPGSEPSSPSRPLNFAAGHVLQSLAALLLVVPTYFPAAQFKHWDD
jgi:hypothetical protein